MVLDYDSVTQVHPVPFDHGPFPPRVCVVDDKPHVRSFLAEMLSDLGFVVQECSAPNLEATIASQRPDLVVVGSVGDDDQIPSVLRRLTTFGGRVMLFGGRNSPTLIRSHELGEKLGLAMLPPLGTPFRDSDIRTNLDCFLPIAPPPDVGIDVDKALKNGWIELRYLPKIDTRSLTPRGAEALIRVRHPVWGLVSPAFFIPAATDPYYHALSQFVIMHAMADWLRFATDGNGITISVSLPTPVLEDPDFLDYVFGKLPDSAAEGRLVIGVDYADILAEPTVVKRAVARLAFRNIGIAVDAIGTGGAMLVGRRDLPVVEMKVQRRFVTGCVDDRIKQAVCAAIATTAHENGALPVAEGVATHGDFVTLRDLGFDLVQGPLFAKPMEAHKFAHSVLSKRFTSTS